MRVSGLGRGRRVELPAMLCVLVMTAVLVGCGGGGETTAPAADGEATPLKRNLSGATVEAGTPAAKAGTPDVPPIPSQIGDCVIEPKTECPGADLRGAGLGFRSFGFGAGVRAKLAGANLQGADLTGRSRLRRSAQGQPDRRQPRGGRPVPGRPAGGRSDGRGPLFRRSGRGQTGRSDILQHHHARRHGEQRELSVARRSR